MGKTRHMKTSIDNGSTLFCFSIFLASKLVDFRKMFNDLAFSLICLLRSFARVWVLTLIYCNLLLYLFRVVMLIPIVILIPCSIL